MGEQADSTLSGEGLRIAGGALAGFVAAALGWSVFGYFVAGANTKLAIVPVIGLVLVVASAGVGAGMAMRLIGRSPMPAARWAACAAAIAGGFVGDFLWIWWFNIGHKSLSVLLGSQFTATLNTKTDLQKLLMYAIAGYLAYAIARSGVRR